MLSLNDIINASFRKSGFSGYKTTDVDQFLDQVRDSYDQLLKKDVEQKELVEKLQADNQQITEKVKILADKVEEYRSQEDEIKNALISAQKMGDASIREARHRAEIIIKDANLKAEHLVQAADEKITEQKKELERLQKTVSDFRSKLLVAYKEHLTLIDALPASKPEPAVQQQAASAAVQPEQQPETADEPAQEEDAFQADISCFEKESAQN